MSKKFDAIILGSGQAGNPLAGSLASQGKSVLLVEEKKLGGTCVNTGCTPSKTFYEAVRKIHHAQDLEYAGYKISKASFEFSTLIDHVRKIRDQFNESLSESLQNIENLDIEYGHGSFTGNNSIEVCDSNGKAQSFEAQQVFINTGARPVVPDIAGLGDIDFLTSESIWELEKQPEKLIIIGGGYIGMEIAQCFARLGSEVHVISHDKQILTREDDDIVELVKELMESEGVKFHFSEEPASVKRTDKGLQLRLKSEVDITGDQLLIAAGRIPNVDKIGLENTDIETSNSGSIRTNEYLQTSLTNVYALGEVAGTPQFTHMSYDDYRVVKSALSGEKNFSAKGRVVPYCLFIDPQLGRFGLNEKQAQKEDVSYHLYEMPMKNFARAAERNETYGKAKVLCDKKGGKILGVSILGFEAGELMSTLLTAMRGGLSAEDLRNATFAHPLMAESLNNLFS